MALVDKVIVMLEEERIIPKLFTKWYEFFSPDVRGRAQFLNNNSTPECPLHQILHFHNAVRQLLFCWRPRRVHWFARQRSVIRHSENLSPPLWNPVALQLGDVSAESVLGFYLAVAIVPSLDIPAKIH